MKILIFMTQFYQLSGAERLAVELAEELNKREIHTDIMSMYTGEMPGVEEAKESLQQKGIPVVHFLGMRIHPSASSMLPAVMRLRRLIQKEKYDIVETSMVIPAIITSWSILGLQTRHIVGLHQVFRGDRENELKHKFFRFTVRCNQRTRYYSITDYAVAHWITYSKTSPRYTRMIYNAIVDECFEIRNDRVLVRKELRIPEEGRLVIYVGRVAAYKGIDTLFDSLWPICQQHNIYLLYIGYADHSVKGTSEMIHQIEKRIADEQLGERIKFLGHQKDIPRLMSAADALAHPTRIEGFGLALAEAMAIGLPIVASNVEAIPEVLSGTDSILVPPDNPENFRAAVLKTLYRTPDQAAIAIAKGRNRAQAFRASNRTDAMIRLFEDLIQGKF